MSSPRMPNVSFSADWLNKFSDPYAVLGISVSADERRIAKRYRDIAKQLHPDLYLTDEAGQQEFANQALAKLVNPTYQRLKQDKGRAEILATLRFRVRRLTRDQALLPKSSLAIKLLNTPPAKADVFYEQAVSQLATNQYASLEQLEVVTQELAELNLVFLRVKMGDPIIRQKRTGLIASPQTQSSQTTYATSDTATRQSAESAEEDYAQRHYTRAVTYAKAGNWTMTIAELKDAIRIQPKRSQYHALIGTAYFYQKLTGMAKVHIRQALKLNPNEKLAQKYAAKLDVKLEPPHSTSTSKQSKPKKNSKGGFLGGLFARRN